MIEFHDAFDLGCVERINQSLSLRNLQLRLAGGESGGRVGGMFVETKGVDCTTLTIFSDVVIGELTGCSKE